MFTIKSRTCSFILVSIIYLLATATGVLCCFVLPFSIWLNVLLADVIATVITFIFSLIFKNASVYDPYWSVQPIIIVIGLAIKYGVNLTVVFAMIAVCLWGVRLTANWAYTFYGLTHQDWRYTMLCEKTGKFYPIINFVGIHMVPTLVVYFAVLPLIIIISNQIEFNPLCLVGFGISIIAVLLQGIADVQMHKYKKNRTTTFIRVGLWKYSRHPNYLGEILMWWGVGLFAIALMPQNWWLLAGAVINTLLFTFVSIPMAEKKQSKKDGYIEYKNSTRVLLPIKK